MAIAEKLVAVADNMPKIYEAGQKSMVDESKIIEKTVSGSVISLDDVSEVPHDVAVQLSSDIVTDFSGVEVDVVGKNLFDKTAYPLTVGKELWATSGNVSNNSANTMASTLDYIPCHNLRELTITISHTYGSNMGVAFYDGSKAFISGVLNNGGTKITATVPDTAVYYRFCMNAVYIDVAQVEVGAVSTDYEPYIKKTYTAEADGTVKGIKSISPNMTIFTEMEGINISATYHKSWGMQTEYDRFWNAFQNNGGVMNGYYAFSGSAWNDRTYNPKYDIKATSFTNMFRSSAISNTKVTIDFSEGTGTYVFNNATNLITVPKIIVNKNIEFTGWFASCALLTEIRFEGIIGKSLDIHWSTKLSMESLASIVGALSKTSTGQTITLPTTARETYDNATISGAWDNLVAMYPNWTFKYA